MDHRGPCGLQLTFTLRLLTPAFRIIQPLFAGVEEMIDKVGFDAEIPPQHVRDEPFRERWRIED